MSFGQFLSNAGVAATSMRAAEESERVARENQLKIEEQNRQAIINQRAAAEYASRRPSIQVPDFLTTNISTEKMPMAAPVAAPAAAPRVPVSAAPAANEGLGLRRMSPEEVARLRQDPYALGSNQPSMSPSELQRERDRLALLKPQQHYLM